MTPFLKERGLGAITSALFDLDGTLVDSLNVHIDSHYAVLKSVSGAASRSEVERAWSAVHWNTDTFYRAFSSKVGVAPEDLVSAHVNDMHERYETHRFAALPGAKKLLEHFNELGVRIAVVTSSSQPLAERALDTADLLSEIDLLVSRERTSSHKPDPAPYLHALSLLSTAPVHAIAFEDSLDGLKAAVAAGLYTFYLGSDREPAAGCEPIGSLNELIRPE